MSNIGEYLRNSREDEQLIIYQEPNKKENREEETNGKCISSYSPREMSLKVRRKRRTEVTYEYMYVNEFVVSRKLSPCRERLPLQS